MSPLGRRRRPIARRRRRVIRRTTRRVWRRTRRIIRGPFVLLALAGATTGVKVHKDDVEKIENELGKPIEELSEKDIKKTMKKLGIKSIELTDDDEQELDNMSEIDEIDNSGQSNFCSKCGAKVKPDSNFCSSCGKEL